MQVEEIDLDELIESLDEGGMKDKLLKTADLLQKLIKPGDPDRHDFAAVRDHIESNNMKTVKQIVMNMDTEPRERVVVAMAKGLGRAETEKILGVKLNMGEEVELDERSAAAQARRDARGEFDDKPEKGDDVATDADKKRGDENIINQLRKALDNPKHEVRFADGKSEVVKPDIVKAALKIFMQLKSNDKRKLQPIYAKSAKSLTSIVSRMMRKMHYEGVEEMNEDFRTGRFGVSHSLVDAVKDVIMGKRVNETNKNDKSDDGEGLDAVQPKAVKKKFKDRKDKDIDNDGDVDDSDKFLHKRRKAVSKAVDKEESKKIKEQDDEDEKETAKKAKKDEPKKNGKEKVEVDPTLDEVKEEMTEAQKAKREEIVKELKKKSADFKEKYGDRWEDVMYATATKMAMKAA